MRNQKKLLIGAVAVFAAALVLIGMYRFLRVLELEESRNEVSSILLNEEIDETERYGDGQLFYNDRWYTPKEQIETILVMGLDQYEGTLAEEGNRNNQRSDFLLLLIVDHETKNCDVLAINRDTMTEITALGLANQVLGTFDAQLTLAHTFGTGGTDSCLNTVDAVSKFLYDTKIDHYVSVTMDAVPIVNDAVGGVTVTIEDDFSAHDPTLKLGETITLKGSQALNFVQGRRYIGDSRNESRMRRQEQYLMTLYEKVKDKIAEDSQFLFKVLLDVSEHIVSDYSVNQISGNANQLLDYQLNEFHNIAGEAVEGEEYMEFYADENKLKEQLVELLYEEA